MPNWCEGSLKLRGKYADIKRFFLEGISCSFYDLSKNETTKLPRDDYISLEEDDGWIDVVIKDSSTWVEGTRRAFINGETHFCQDDEKSSCCVVNVRQAWDLLPENWVDISKKFNLDIRLYGIECGMQFCHEIEIIGGEVLLDEIIKYNDWQWECPFPNMGG